MATPVIQSSNNYAWTANTSPVITKPTGLAVGDLMLALIFSVDSVGSPVDEPTTPTNWTRFSNAFYDGASDTIRAYVFWKIADSGDTSATNFTFVCDTTSSTNAGWLGRITGHNATAPLTSLYYTNGSTGTNPTITGANVSTVVNDALLFMSFCGFVALGSETTSIYTINGTNPTWTELLDISSSTGINELACIASAPESAVRIVTQIECDTSGTISENVGQFFVIPATTSTSTNLDLISLSQVPYDLTNTGTANVTLDVISLTATPRDITGSQADPKWSNPDKNTTTWVNPDKSV